MILPGNGGLPETETGEVENFRLHVVSYFDAEGVRRWGYSITDGVSNVEVAGVLAIVQHAILCEDER